MYNSFTIILLYLREKEIKMGENVNLKQKQIVFNWIHKNNITTLVFNLFTSNIIKTLVVLMLATASSIFFVRFSDNNHYTTLFYVLAVLIISRITTGYIWGVIASVTGVFGVNYFFTFPFMAFNFTLPGYPVTFISMLIISIITSAMTVQIKQHATRAKENEQKTKFLYQLNNKLLLTRNAQNIIDITLDYLQQFTNHSVVFYQLNQMGEFNISAKCILPQHENFLKTSSELFAVQYSMKHKIRSGAKTDVCSKAVAQYIPVVINDNVLGVIGIIFQDNISIESVTDSLFDLMVVQFAMAMERQQLSDEQEKIRIESEKEKMRSNLLRAISHDLRTPLTSILGSTLTIIESKGNIDTMTEEKLLFGIKEDSQWLIRMVENLLTVTKISDGATHLKTSLEAVEEVVAQAISRVRVHFTGRKITVKVPDEFVMAPMDATLIEQVIINLVENALKHSGKDTIVNVCVTGNKDKVVFEISDNGKGIDSRDIPYLFQQYPNESKIHSDATRGMGIGLSICLSIIKAHGGEMTAYNRENSGAVFCFALPLN